MLRQRDTRPSALGTPAMPEACYGARRAPGPLQTGPGDCLHQCGLKTTVLDWCNSSDIYTWTTTRRRPQPFFRVVWLLVALMHAGYGRLTSAPEQKMSWPCLQDHHRITQSRTA